MPKKSPGQLPPHPPPAEQQQPRLDAIELLRGIEAVGEVALEDVGERFAHQGRKIHYGETRERKIRGTASQDEVTALRDEGIDVVPLPGVVPAGKSH